jgi:hypothetical protein
MPKWDKLPHTVWLDITHEDGTVHEYSCPISKRLYEACQTLQTQEKYERVNPIYQERVVRWVMKILRWYRRDHDLDRIVDFIPPEAVRIKGYDYLQTKLFY